jgi:hypothetical protein
MSNSTSWDIQLHSFMLTIGCIETGFVVCSNCHSRLVETGDWPLAPGPDRAGNDGIIARLRAIMRNAVPARMTY